MNEPQLEVGEWVWGVRPTYYCPSPRSRTQVRYSTICGVVTEVLPDYKCVVVKVGEYGSASLNFDMTFRSVDAANATVRRLNQEEAGDRPVVVEDKR